MTDKAERWEPFTEQEQAIICVGLVMVLMDQSMGLLGNVNLAAFDRDAAVIYKMVGEINERVNGVGVDPAVMESLKMRAQARAGAEGRN